MAKRQSFLSKWEAVIRATPKPVKAHKYGAVKTVVDDITFASKAEARRYSELKLLEKAGTIAHLVLQPKFPLYVWDCDAGHEVQIGTWVGDFQYWDGDKTVIEDVKGVRTPVYRLKKKIVEHRLGISITEIGGRERRSTQRTRSERVTSERSAKTHTRKLGSEIQE